MRKIIFSSFIALIALSMMLLVSCDIDEILHTHSFGEWEVVKNPTCTEDGSKIRACSCGETEVEILSATGHTEEIASAVPATCTESGLTEGKKCSVCSEFTVKQGSIPNLGHDYEYHTESGEDGNPITVAVCQRKECANVQSPAAGLYDEKNILLAPWYELVNVYGLNGLANLSVILDENENLKNGTTLFIDDSIIEMNFSLFEHCESITKIIVPSSVINIKNTSRSSCVHLKNIIVDENNEYYKSIDGNLYSKDGKILIQYASGKEDKEFAIPDGVETIGSTAIMCSRFLEKLYIPNSVTLIELHGFGYYCDALTDIYFAGTTEEWDAIEEKVPTKWWLSNNILIHYDGKMQFAEKTFWEAGNGSLPRFEYVLNGEKIYINDILYEQMIGADKLEFENEERILSEIENKSDGRTDIVKQLFDNENWYVLQTDANVTFPCIVTCQIDNVWYFIYLTSGHYIYHIGYTLIDLEI